LAKTVITRQSLIAGIIGAIILVTVGATDKYAFREPVLLCPAGSQREDKLLAKYIKYDRRSSACPTGAISILIPKQTHKQW